MTIYLINFKDKLVESHKNPIQIRIYSFCISHRDLKSIEDSDSQNLKIKFYFYFWDKIRVSWKPKIKYNWRRKGLIIDDK